MEYNLQRSAAGFTERNGETGGFCFTVFRGGSSFTSQEPRFTDAGTYTVQIKAEHPNYADTPIVPVTVTVNPKEVPIAVNPATKVYGQADPKFSGTFNTKDLIAPNDLGTVTYVRKTSDQKKEDVGDDITLTIRYTENPNYKIALTTGKLTITQAGDNSVSLAGQKVTYDGKAYGLKAASAAVEGSTLWYSTDRGATYRKDVPTFTAAGTYAVWVKATCKNYQETEPASGIVIISPRPVTITVANASKKYAADDPIFSGNITGITGESPLVKADDLGTIQYVRKSEHADRQNVGDVIELIATYDQNKNYVVTMKPGALTITKAAALLNVVTAVGSTQIYDGSAYGLSEAHAAQDGSTLLYSTTGVDFTTSAPTFTEAGTYTVYVKATNPNYEDTDTSSATVVINPREITLNARGGTKEYDGTPI
ncbi:MAG: MBG domain-containing protein, partial [Hungatella sp.]